MKIELEPRVKADPETLAWMRRVAQAINGVPIARGATAGRPAAGTGDAGAMYFDTTLAAAGKPIWWTGLAWVDATGTAV